MGIVVVWRIIMAYEKRTAEIDGKGRIPIPIDIRRQLNIDHKVELEILVKQDSLVLRRFVKDGQVCTFCNTKEKLVNYKSQKICRLCIEDLKNQS
jgi:transcriptional pleiotropic regulator of transition state genes